MNAAEQIWPLVDFCGKYCIPSIVQKIFIGDYIQITFNYKKSFKELGKVLHRNVLNAIIRSIIYVAQQ